MELFGIAAIVLAIGVALHLIIKALRYKPPVTSIVNNYHD